jgi:hypothetical protein
VTRGDLERLDRDALIARAEAAGVARARILTRPELVDELLLRSATDDVTKERARGLFGRARDLLARLVERGLNKPATADRIRAVGRPVGRPTAPAALPTVTLAEIYVAQGYRERAMETLERVLSAEPDHLVARALLDRLRDAAFPVPAPRMPPESDQEDGRDHAMGTAGPAPNASAVLEPASSSEQAPVAEPTHMLDDVPLPPRYDVDECVAVAVDPRTLYVYWEVREGTMEGLRARSVQATITIRVVAVQPSWSGPEATVRDLAASGALGELFVGDLPPGSVIRAAVGVWTGAEFVPIAHCPPVEIPPSGPAPLPTARLVRWTPLATRPIADDEEDGPAIRRVIHGIRQDSASAWRQVQPVRVLPATVPLGASERVAGAGPSRH